MFDLSVVFGPRLSEIYQIGFLFGRDLENRETQVAVNCIYMPHCRNHYRRGRLGSRGRACSKRMRSRFQTDTSIPFSLVTECSSCISVTRTSGDFKLLKKKDRRTDRRRQADREAEEQKREKEKRR